jgi:thiamine biosynthesis lipoprotein
MVPVVEIENGSIASSSGREHRKRRGSETLGPHVDTARGRAMGTRSFVSVTAPQCLDADALTKVVLALGARSSALLSECGATAHLYNARDGWRTYGAGT